MRACAVSAHAARDTARAMSQENVEIVRRIHGLWDSGGQLAAATELLDRESSG